MTLPHIPLLRFGQPYRSLDTSTVLDFRTGEPLAELGQANAGLVSRDLRNLRHARDRLRRLTVAELLEITRKAGELFLSGRLPFGIEGEIQSPGDYVATLSRTSGLPHSLCRKNMEKVHDVLTRMSLVLKGLTRNLDLSVLDEGIGVQDGISLCFSPVTDGLGAVLPSNSPGVNSLWLPAVPLKIPVILKPGREEPWTPYRIMQAFMEAGCPREAFCFYPTDHEGAGVILQNCERSLLFGDASTTVPYAGDPRVQIHGPGWSKVLLGADQAPHWREFADVLVESVTSNGGRSCINASAVVTASHGREIAEFLGEAFSRIVPRAPEDPEAVLSAFANPALADFIDEAITNDLKIPGAEDLSARFRDPPRKITVDGRLYLLPTVVWCESFDHPLANREFLFPYTSVVEMPQETMLETIGPSLVVTAITEDRDFIDALIRSPAVDRLNIGPIPTSHVEWDQPHEGNLFEFLYRRRAIQRRG